jgi:hypothetical protein
MVRCAARNGQRYSLCWWVVSYLNPQVELNKLDLYPGTAAGGLLLPLSLPRLMSKYGPSKTLRILAVGTTILLFPLLPFLKGRLPQTRVRIQGPVPRGASGTRNWMKDKLFWIFLVVNTLQGFAYFIPIIYLPSTCNNSPTTSTYRSLAFANDLHISSSNSAVTLAMLNGIINHCLGRL